MSTISSLPSNPYIIHGRLESHRWSIYRREDWVKIATFRNQIEAYGARRAILKSEQQQ